MHNANATYTSATVYDTITVDSTALSGRSLINAVAELDGKVVINTGAGADIITGSASANFGDSITSGAGNDTLKFAYDGLTSAECYRRCWYRHLGCFCRAVAAPFTHHWY